MRGPHPKDRELFTDSALQRLREGASDLRYLLGRGYAKPGALKLVGDRFQFVKRQRQLLFRSVMPPQEADAIRRRTVKPEAVSGNPLLVDGHNALITTETALAGGLLIRCDDGFLRDIAERHGSYRQSPHTGEAISFIRKALEELSPARVSFFFDRPIPFSGLLAKRVREALGAEVSVEVAASADGALKDELPREANAIVATSDSALLLSCPRVFDLTGYVVGRFVPSAWIVSVSEKPP